MLSSELEEKAAFSGADAKAREARAHSLTLPESTLVGVYPWKTINERFWHFFRFLAARYALPPKIEKNA